MARKGKREYGSGSIYRNKDGSWTAQERIEGHLIRRRAPTEQTAKEKLAELQKLKRDRIDVHSGAQLVAAWMSAYFTQKLRQRDPKPRTIEFNRDMIERYILPALGDMRLIDLRPTHVQAALDGIRDDIRSSTAYDGARTVHAVARILGEALTLAHERKLIPDNPYSGIVLPKYKRGKIEPMDDSQLRAFFAAVSSHRLFALWLCYSLLGLRRGEGLALQWAGFDREKRTIRIDQQVQRIDGRELLIGTPKTDDSVRLLPVPRQLFDALCFRWDEAQQERALKDWKEHTLIFPSQVGTPMWPDNLERMFREARDSAGLPRSVKLHHFRHTLSTLLDECGATETIKAGILGHAKQTQTQKYTHARLEAMRDVLQRVADRVLGGAAEVLTKVI